MLRPFVADASVLVRSRGRLVFPESADVRRFDAELRDFVPGSDFAPSFGLLSVRLDTFDAFASFSDFSFFLPRGLAVDLVSACFRRACDVLESDASEALPAAPAGFFEDRVALLVVAGFFFGLVAMGWLLLPGIE